MEQVPMVTRYFINTGKEAGYIVVLHILLPMVAELTTDRNAQVSNQFSSFILDLNYSPLPSPVLMRANGTIRCEQLLLILSKLWLISNFYRYPQPVFAISSLLLLLPPRLNLLLFSSPDIIHHEDLEPYLIPIIKSLANDTTEEEHRVEAATLFHNLASVFGPELCMQVVLPLVVKLAEDSVFRVRKAIAANIGNVSLCF